MHALCFVFLCSDAGIHLHARHAAISFSLSAFRSGSVSSMENSSHALSFLQVGEHLDTHPFPSQHLIEKPLWGREKGTRKATASYDGIVHPRWKDLALAGRDGSVMRKPNPSCSRASSTPSRSGVKITTNRKKIQYDEAKMSQPSKGEKKG